MVKAIRASALILLLACSAQAGHMQNDSPSPPPPSPPASAAQGATDADPELTTSDTAEDGTQGTLTQIALDLLTILPSLL